MTPRELVADTLLASAAECRAAEVAGLLAAAGYWLVADDADALATAEVEGIRWTTVLTFDLGDETGPRLATIATHNPASPAAEVWRELAATLDRWTETATDERLRHRIETELTTYAAT